MNKRSILLIGAALAFGAVAANLWFTWKSGNLTQAKFFTTDNGPGLEDLALGLAILFVALAIM